MNEIKIKNYISFVYMSYILIVFTKFNNMLNDKTFEKHFKNL